MLGLVFNKVGNPETVLTGAKIKNTFLGIIQTLLKKTYGSCIPTGCSINSVSRVVL